MKIRHIFSMFLLILFTIPTAVAMLSSMTDQITYVPTTAGHNTEYDIVTKKANGNINQDSIESNLDIPKLERQTPNLNESPAEQANEQPTSTSLETVIDTNEHNESQIAIALTAVDHLFTHLQQHELSSYLDTHSYYTENHHFIITEIDESDTETIITLCSELEDMLTENDNISCTFEEFSFNTTHPFLSRFETLEYLITKFL